METEQAGILVTIMDVANIGAWIVIAYMFMQGKIVSSATMDRITRAIQESTHKLATEISEKIENSVYNGTVKAHTDIKNGNVKIKE